MKLNTYGFSLIELMVGGALLAGIGLAGAQLMKDQKNAQAKIDHELELDLIHAKISDGFLENAKDCDATFRSFYNAAATGAVITNIQICTSNCSPELDAQTTIGTPLYSTGISAPEISPRSLWYIESFGPLTPTNGQAPNRTNLMTFSVNYVHQRLANRRVTKFVTVPMRFDSAGRFKQCVNAATTNIQNLEREICQTLVAYNSTGQLIRGMWNGDTQKCHASLAVNCPKGHVPEGIRPGPNLPNNGCVRSTQSILPAQLNRIIDPTPVSCWNGPHAVNRVYLAPSSMNRIGLVCR